MFTLHWALLALYAVLQIADGYTTLKGSQKGAAEANPVLSHLMTCAGPAVAVVLLKTLATVPFAFLTPSRYSCAVLLILCILYVITVVNNIQILRRM